MDPQLAIVSLTGSEAEALPQEARVSGNVSDTATLTVAMARGSEAAFAEFFEQYFNRLLRYLLAVTRGDDSAAKDALQDTLTRVAKHVRRFDEEQAFWAWLTVLARSAARDLGRKQSRYRNLLSRFFERGEAVISEDSSEERLNDALGAGLKSLSSDDRELLERKYFERSTVRELAHELRLTEKAVESRLLRARKQLREAINQHLNHE